MDTADGDNAQSNVPGNTLAVTAQGAEGAGAAAGTEVLSPAVGGSQDDDDSEDDGGVVFVAAVKRPPGQVDVKEEKPKSYNAIKYPESNFEEQPAMLGVLFSQCELGAPRD